MSIDNATVEELQQAIVNLKKEERAIARRTLAEHFVSNGLEEFTVSVKNAETLEDVYKLANNFTSRYVRVRHVLGLPVGTRGRKSKSK